jgi:hypothetical protein
VPSLDRFFSRRVGEVARQAFDPRRLTAPGDISNKESLPANSPRSAPTRSKGVVWA